MEAYVKLCSEAFVRVSVLRVFVTVSVRSFIKALTLNGAFNPNNENELKYEFVELAELFAYYI